MPIEPGTYPVIGPIVDISGALLPASTGLRDAGVISLRNGQVMKVNSAGDDWEPIPIDNALFTGLVVLDYPALADDDDIIVRDKSQQSVHRSPLSAARQRFFESSPRANPALPARPNSSVATDAAGTAYELTPMLTKNDIFPHVVRLPDHTLAASPDLIYLDHDIIQGPASDATLTVGTWNHGFGNLVGYSDFINEGTINRSSPLVSIFGPGTAADYSIDTITSANQAWIDDFTHVEIAGTQYALAGSYRTGFLYVRAIQNPPTGLNDAQLSLNFIRSDATSFFVGTGGLTLFFSGLYEKLNSGYSRVVSSGFSHTRGSGPPTVDPEYEGQAYINELGQLWVAGGTFRHIETSASGTSSAFVHVKYVRDPADQPDIISMGGDGGFWWPIAVQTIGNFWQTLGILPPLDQTRTWNEVWTYITTLSGFDVASNQRRRDNSQFFGGFSSAQDAYEALDRIITQADFDGGTTDYYWGLNSFDPTAYGVQRVSTWAAATIVETDTLFWNGPFYTVIDLVNWVGNNAEAMNDSLLRAGYGITADDRHEVNQLAEVLKKVQEISTATIVDRAWAAAVVGTEGTILTFEDDPLSAGLLAGTWTSNAVLTPHSGGLAYYGVRIPLANDIRNYEVRETNTADASFLKTVQGTYLTFTAQDATYKYYLADTRIRTTTMFALFYDEVTSPLTHYRGLVGKGDGFGMEIHTTQASYDAASDTDNVLHILVLAP